MDVISQKYNTIMINSCTSYIYIVHRHTLALTKCSKHLGDCTGQKMGAEEKNDNQGCKSITERLPFRLKIIKETRKKNKDKKGKGKLRY